MGEEGQVEEGRSQEDAGTTSGMCKHKLKAYYAYFPTQYFPAKGETHWTQTHYLCRCPPTSETLEVEKGNEKGQQVAQTQKRILIPKVGQIPELGRGPVGRVSRRLLAKMIWVANERST